MYKNLATNTKMFLRSWPNRIFLLLVLLFIVEASYIALVSSYPMAFDESYHFGLIQFFTQHLNPIVSTQDPSTYSYGNIAHNPSWLYHYLLSFPYRLLALTGSLRVEIVGLRLINIGLAVTSLVLLWKISHKITSNRWVGLIVTAAFALTPVFTVLSTQINYDNLMILMTLLGANLLLNLIRQNRENKLQLSTILALVIVISLGSLVKYSFLPIALLLAVSILLVLFSAAKNSKIRISDMLRKGTVTNTVALIILGVTAIGGTSLAATYYGQNILQYKTPVPDCAQVLKPTACMAWGPWARNYNLALEKKANPTQFRPNFQDFATSWTKTMVTQPYGNIAPGGLYEPVNLIFIKIILFSLALCTAIALLTGIRLLKKYPQVILLVFLAAAYLAALFYRNYSEYLRYGTPVAVQGRYFVPVLGFVYLVLILSVYTWAKDKSRTFQGAKYALATVVLASFVVWGGTADYTSSILPDYHWSYVSPTQDALNTLVLKSKT